ncbi:hypothetical protein DFH07DRAFT_1056474 [Mycena maculata]|uniref:Zn(2)-C6 fungal-type domain-containing protein n=1 Tax=Mycena maculata TaxID=230809 RepID=A0AAD7K6F2_9AGAR|nr:hypothetical protein DFH07DRAFT_1056474 [Mycena maculata]
MFSLPAVLPIHEKPKKPPACDACKARHVLCHPQPDGAPCPRCVEGNIICSTTGGRRREAPVSKSSSLPLSRRSIVSLKSTSGPLFEGPGKCPSLNPDFISHCFECLPLIPQYGHPLIWLSGIRVNARTVSFQLERLPLESRALALAIAALGSLISFHESVLGQGPRPESFADLSFFRTHPDLFSCGMRRALAFRSLRAEAFKAAWEAGIMLQPSIENAASCFLLDLLEQADLRNTSRPWANAYAYHVRVLTPTLRAEDFNRDAAGQWAAFFTMEAMLSTRRRAQLSFTLNDQLGLYVSEPSSLEDLLVSLETSLPSRGLAVLWAYMPPYLFHIPCLARLLSDTITGDYARLTPLSEAASVRFLSRLSILHSILSLLLNHIDATLAPAVDDHALLRVNSSVEAVVRLCAYTIGLSFASLVLPFYSEVIQRDVSDLRTYERIQILRAQARDMAVLGARELARAIRYLPALHYTPIDAEMVLAWAEFYAEDMDERGSVTPESARDLETLVGELKLLGYSLDAFSARNVNALIQRLEGHVHPSSRTFSIPGDLLLI